MSTPTLSEAPLEERKVLRETERERERDFNLTVQMD